MYYKARNLALGNNQTYHLAAILYRNGKPIRIATNSSKTHPCAYRTYPDGESGAALHAEMDVLRFARPNDDLEVIRFTKSGKVTMAKPCCHCQRMIKEKQIRRTRYTDWDGAWQTLEP